MGGFMEFLLSIRHPDRISALIAASAGSGAHLPTRNAFIQETLNVAERVINEGSFPANDVAHAGNRIQLKHKDPQGWAEFRDHLAEHHSIGSGYTLKYVQTARPGLHEFEAELAASNVPTFLMVGDEDDACLDVNLWLKRTMPMSGLSVFPKSGHLLSLE